jgi:Clustered mitochondria
MVELIGEFQEVATFHARRMIDEYHINPTYEHCQKSYKVNQNLCCVKDGVVLQFACNYNGTLKLNAEATAEDGEIAHSKTSGELRGIDMVVKAAARVTDESPSMFHTILMALVDYKGFRVVAHADMSSQRVDMS